MDVVKSLRVNKLHGVRDQNTLFRDLSFELSSGDILFIEGENGAGKSTLLRILSSLALPSSGDIIWCHQLISVTPTHYTDAMHYIGHRHGIKSGLTVAENIRLMSHLALIKPDAKKEQEVLHLLQLSNQAHTQTAYLSAGQKRRVALARLVLIPKPLWLLDEPFTALDQQAQGWLIKQVENHVSNGGIAIISSHQPMVFESASVKHIRLGTC